METNNKEIKRRSTFSLLFYINRTKVRKDGTCKLLCKVSIDAKSAPININAFVDPSLWNPETKRANGRSENARTVNQAIEKLTEKITGHYRHIRKSLGFVTAELVKNAVEGIGQKPFTLLALFREHNEEFRKRVGVDRKEETYESYENSYNILASFVKKRKEKEDVALRSLDREFYDDFEIFLRTDREMKPKTVHEHLYRLKKMTKRAVSQGTLRRDPYGKLHPELPRRKSRHLKLEDLKKLMETPVGKPNLQRVRDWFLFATFTGLSYADLKRLSEKDITQSDDGTYWIHIRRQKTETPSAIRLLNVPKRIIEKYKGLSKDDHVFPVPSNGRCNTILKELGRQCGFKIRLTYHVARHTNATTVLLSHGVPIETVSRLLGHTDLKTTQIYARITNQKISSDMEILSHKLEKMEKEICDAI